ncbi:MAG: hypothetical protein WDM96_04040 [Lacunisphaera sp.]
MKRYYVSLEEPFPASRLRQLLRGVVIEGEHLKVERANLVNPQRPTNPRPNSTAHAPRQEARDPPALHRPRFRGAPASAATRSAPSA